MTKKVHKILFDLDGVLNNIDATILKKYKKLHPSYKFIPLHQRTGQCSDLQYLSKFGQKEATAIHNILKTPGFFRDIEPNFEAIEAIKILNRKRNLKIFICTSPWYRNPSCVQDKFDWVEEHIGKPWLKKLIITPEKGMVKADVLFDDKANVSGDFQHILVRCDHNKTEIPKSRYILENWSQTEEIIVKVLDNKNL